MIRAFRISGVSPVSIPSPLPHKPVNRRTRHAYPLSFDRCRCPSLTTVLPGGLEATATKDGDQLQTDVNTDMKVSAFSAAVTAAFNILKARVDAFDGRISALEAWRTSATASIASLQSRVGTLEGLVNYLYYSWRPWVENYLANLNNRLATVESRPTGPTRAVRTGCYEMAGWYGTVITCNSADEFVVGVCSSGRDPDCGGGFTRITCCRIQLQ